MKILDLTDAERSDIRYRRMWFPDGQPHFELLEPADIGKGERVEVLCRIKSASDIVDVGMAIDVLLASVPFEAALPPITLNVAYMLGARMDRRIDRRQPFTLSVLARMLKVAADEVHTIRVLDPHSDVTRKMLRIGRAWESKAIHPDRLVSLALQHYGADATIVIPDEGAVPRTTGIVERLGLTNPVARCMKKRDSATGALSGFALVEGDVAGRRCLIVDDICDGGGTFAGIAAVLREAGASSVALCVTHGIFSKGLSIPGIDRTYCTDSFDPLRSVLGAVAERRDQLGFIAHRSPGKAPILYVLPDFVRDHVRGLDGPAG